jgi:hypothetical protein
MGPAPPSILSKITLLIFLGQIVGDRRLPACQALGWKAKNVVGIAIFFYPGDLAPKRLQLLRQLLSNAVLFGVLADPQFPVTQSTVADLQAAARVLGLQDEPNSIWPTD